MTRSPINRIILVVILGAVSSLLALWEFAITQDRFLGFVLGQPSFIARYLVHDVAYEGLLGDVAYTLSAALLGLTAGVVAGGLVGFAVAYNRTGDAALSPVLNILSVVPLFAIGPMTIFWFGQGLTSKVFLAGLASSLLTAALIYQYVRSTPLGMKELVWAMARRRSAVFWRVEAPFASLSLLTNLRPLLGMAVSGAVIGEFIGSDRGVGHYIVVAEGLYDVNRIWAGVVALSIGTIVLAGFAIVLENFARARL